MDDNKILLIFIIPYVFDFIAGVFTFILMYRISIFNDFLNLKNKNNSKIFEKEKYHEEVNQNL